MTEAVKKLQGREQNIFIYLYSSGVHMYLYISPLQLQLLYLTFEFYGL